MLCNLQFAKYDELGSFPSVVVHWRGPSMRNSGLGFRLRLDSDRKDPLARQPITSRHSLTSPPPPSYQASRIAVVPAGYEPNDERKHGLAQKCNCTSGPHPRVWQSCFRHQNEAIASCLPALYNGREIASEGTVVL